MNYYIGLDLGTSGLKGLLVDRLGNVIKESNESYPVHYPRDGWSEQNPEDWTLATRKILKTLSQGVEGDVKGISIGGQMHGLVILDEQDNVIRPAILWNDGRTQKQTDYLNDVIGKERLSALTANIAFAGFTAPKILWMKENEPENFAKIAKIMLPKDYVAYILTGVHSCDYSDASGTLLLDVEHKCWSKDMCKICSVKEEWLPRLYESYEVTGKVLKEFGLPNAVFVAGAGDNAAAAIGTGTVKNGSCNISLVTSGPVFISGDTFSVDKKNALHAFAHANGKWHLMGCILSAASANKWWLEDILKTNDYAGAIKDVSLGENSVYFLPYLMGERSPHNDVNARGAFLGMRANTTREEMNLAVLEGVAFALRDCVEVARSSGIVVSKTTICGGGARSEVWKKIIANVLNAEVVSLETEQGPSYGAVILAMVGTGEYATVKEATDRIVKEKSSVLPEKDLTEKYEAKYQKFKKLYPCLKSWFEE